MTRQSGPYRREICGQPVETVQDRERRIDARGRNVAVRHRRARETEQSGGDSGRRVQQVVAHRLGCLGERGLEELPHHSEGKVALQLRSPRAKDAHPVGRRGGPGGGEQRRLPDPRRPFDHQERAAPGARLGEYRIDPRQLSISLEERFSAVA